MLIEVLVSAAFFFCWDIFLNISSCNLRSQGAQYSSSSILIVVCRVEFADDGGGHCGGGGGIEECDVCDFKEFCFEASVIEVCKRS